MTAKQANELIDKKITVRHKISGELFTVTLVKRLNGIIYEQDNGEYFIITPVELVTKTLPIWEMLD
jgi:hypothetical protein